MFVESLFQHKSETDTLPLLNCLSRKPGQCEIFFSQHKLKQPHYLIFPVCKVGNPCDIKTIKIHECEGEIEDHRLAPRGLPSDDK